MTEDKKLAEKMVLADAKRMFKSLRELLPTDVLTFAELDNYKADKGKPFINLTIGACGKLSRSEAKDAGEMWKKIVRRWPQGPVYIHFLGYDDDPRELWEISKVTRYVRMWAHYAGIRDARDVLPNMGEWGVGFLTACGVPGEGVKVVLPPKTTEH